MQIKVLAVLLIAIAVVVTGCVETVSGNHQAGVPFVKDKIESRYERPSDQVYQAAKQVIQFNGVLGAEKIIHGRTNAVDQVAKVLEGKVSQTTVWVSVEQVERNVSAVAVQTRTRGGAADIDLAAEIDKQIALKLVH